MGVFGKKKPKAPEQPDNFAFLDDPNDSSALQSKFSRSLKRKQKNPVAPKPEFNINTALPSSNDFRTSLMMPQFSARFSMLREQDDPTTKVGKASDDSVLFPKRASRLNLFSHNPLTDIAEVESVRSSIRKPFAETDRPWSLSDGYNSDDGGSIMSRARPGEGNVLFGGRQKMYRVPAGNAASKTLIDGDRGGGMRKHMYEDDVSLSMFQQLRVKAREERDKAGDEDRRSSPRFDEHEDAGVNSPSTPFSKNRGTTSSTTSGPSNRRTSTAATSVDSESPIPRQNSLHTNAQSSRPRTSDVAHGPGEELGMKRNPSSDSRKGFGVRENIAQPPLPTAPVLKKSLSQSRSAVNLGEKYARPGPFSPNGFRAVSPPPVSNSQVMASLDFGLSDSLNRTTTQARRYQTASPTGQGSFEGEDSDIYSKNLQPNDRGKATAMGLFNRPQQQFDEQQYLQRQRQMHEGWNTSLSNAQSRMNPSPEAKSSLAHSQENLSSTTFLNYDRKYNAPSAGDVSYAESISSSTTIKDSRDYNSATKSAGTPASRSRQQSSGSGSSKPVDNVKARVESLIRRQNAELAALEVERNVSSMPYDGRRPSASSQQPDTGSRGTFFNNFDGSDEEGDGTLSHHKFNSKLRTTSADIHPALRDGTNDFVFRDDSSSTPHATHRGSNTTEFSVRNSFNPESDSNRGSAQARAAGNPSDSPTLGPTSGLGLSGLIRTHLRNDSDKSSILPPSPHLSQVQRTNTSREASVASTARTANGPESVHSDPWEYEGAARIQKSPRLGSQPEAMPSLPNKAQRLLGHSVRHQASSKAQQVLGFDAPSRFEDQSQPRQWQDETVQTHRRGESTETQKERQDFDNELAERRRRINEKMGRAPETDPNERPSVPTQPFPGMPHNFGNMPPAGRYNDSSSKAMRMLGIEGGGREDESSSRPQYQDATTDYERETQNIDRSWRPTQPPAPPADANYMTGRRTPGGQPDYSSGRRTPGGQSEYSNGRRTPGDGRRTPGAYSEHSTGRRTPGDGRRTPGGGRPQYVGNPSYEEFERQRQRSATPNSGPRRERANSEAAERSKSRNGGYRDDENYPPRDGRQGSSRSPPEMDQRRPSGSPQDVRYERSASAMSGRSRSASRSNGSGYPDGPPPPPLNTMPMATVPIAPPRPSPRPPVPPSPMGPFAHPGVSPAFPVSAGSSAVPSPVASSQAQTGTGQSNIPFGGRKRSVTKTMISEPTLISSTSQVPLVGLPAGSLVSPPVPAMNPRRRALNAGDPVLANNVAQPGAFSNYRSPVHTMYESTSAYQPDFEGTAAQRAYGDGSLKSGPSARHRNRLRKTSSEGGNMAARARQQALMMELGREQGTSPAVPVFPNHSATSLGMGQEGAMF